MVFHILIWAKASPKNLQKQKKVTFQRCQVWRICWLCLHIPIKLQKPLLSHQTCIRSRIILYSSPIDQFCSLLFTCITQLGMVLSDKNSKDRLEISANTEQTFFLLNNGLRSGLSWFILCIVQRYLFASVYRAWSFQNVVLNTSSS